MAQESGGVGIGDGVGIGIGDGVGVGVRSSDGGRAEAALRARREQRVQSLQYADEARTRANAMRKLAAMDDDEGGGGSPTGKGKEKASAASASSSSSHASADASNERAASGASFGARLVRRIAENLQFEIDAVSVELRACGCSAGVVLDSLSLVTTDENGQRTFVDRTQSSSSSGADGGADSFLYKSLMMRGLGVYCDEDDERPLEKALRRTEAYASSAASSSASDPAKGRAGAAPASPRASPHADHAYILSPLSFHARLRQSDLVRCVDFPKYKLTSELHSLSVMLSRSQLELGRKIADAVRPRDVARPLFPEYRPALAVSRSTAKEWWVYAVRCVGRLNRRRSWVEFCLAYRKRRKYVPLYKRAAHHKECPWLPNLLPSEAAELDRLEQDRTISAQGIMCWRNIADAQVERERAKREAARRDKEEERARRKGAEGDARPASKSAQQQQQKQRRAGWSGLFGTAAAKAAPSESDHTSPSARLIDGGSDDGGGEPEPPIQLTPEEMKELESIGLSSTSDPAALSADSKLCDVAFALGSFRVDLAGYGLRPLTSLHMGKAAASFRANADGSYESGLTLSSLRVDDRATPGTLFPSVLRSLQHRRSAASTKAAGGGHAFEFVLKKSHSGDQDLALRTVAFEIVASSNLLKEVKAFFADDGKAAGAFARPKLSGGVCGANPVLEQSVSGDVDLFYDANLGESEALPKIASREPDAGVDADAAALESRVPTAADRLQAAFADAWNSKTEGRKKWTVECDIDAPILVLPENCANPDSNALVFDLGSFRFLLGKEESLSPQVQRWFDAKPTADEDAVVDFCSLEMKRLTFLVGKAGRNDWSGEDTMQGAVGSGVHPRPKSQAVIEPITLALNVGIESRAAASAKSRTCVYGILPAVSLQISPSLLKRVFSVYTKWMSVLGEMDGTAAPSASKGLPSLPEDDEGGIQILDEEGEEATVASQTKAAEDNKPSKKNQPKASPSLTASAPPPRPAEAFEHFHISVALRRLSARVTTDRGDGLEAHLVSVAASSTLSTDGSSSTRLRMGWFWTLDRLDVPFPRRRRIVAHSNLPRSAAEYDSEAAAEGGTYRIMEDLVDQGVFEDGYVGSADLADIRVKKTPGGHALHMTESGGDLSELRGLAKFHVDAAMTVVDANFTSLFLNWNPHAIKNLLAVKSTLFDFGSETASQNGVVPQKQQTLRARTESAQSFTSQDVAAGKRTTESACSKSLSIINAKMDNLQIYLNSAKDDLPLFIMTMANTQVDFQSQSSNDGGSDEDDMKMGFIVGDIRVETPPSGKTLECYRTILGLAPSQSTSLLQVEYGKGTNVLDNCTVDGFDRSRFTAYADVELSPMRFVHVHSQVFTLIEYLTEGVLGALTAQVASTAAAAAAELAEATDGDKLFFIKATGFDLVLPAAAFSMDLLALRAGDLLVRYVSLANNCGGRAQLYLSEVTLKCGDNIDMVYTPIQMSIGVSLRPYDAPTEDDRATRVDVDISQASFLLTKRHYAQILDTLTRNIGEADSFLRDGDGGAEATARTPGGDGAEGESRDLVVATTAATTATERKAATEELTHGGVQLVEIQKRMYINLRVEELGVELCGASNTEPIVFIAAVESNITLRLLPDTKRTCAEVKLHDVVCEDRRMKAFGRRFRRLVSQVQQGGHHDEDGELDRGKKRDVFILNYTKYSDTESTDMDLTIGSPQVVFIPDAVVEVMGFIHVDSSQTQTQTKKEAKGPSPLKGEDDSVDMTSLEVFVSNSGGGIETSFGSNGAGVARRTKKMQIRIKTTDWRLVLVDMASPLDGDVSKGSPNTSTLRSTTQLTETVVLQGKMEIGIVFTYDFVTGNGIGSVYEVHGQRIEGYTAHGEGLITPVQLLEPAKFSMFYSFTKLEKENKEETEIKLVTLSNFELILSMQNVALLRAIMTSIKDSFAEANNQDQEMGLHELIEKEASRIERLASALEKDEIGSTSDRSITSASAGFRGDISHLDSSYHCAMNRSESEFLAKAGRIIRLRVTVPETTLQLVNDFQGRDDALFKLLVKNLVAGGELDYPPENVYVSQKFKDTGPLFRFNMNTSILANYFDTHSNYWEPFLVRPWEITFNCLRAPKKGSKRNSTTFDIESNPCYVSFSEQFLVSAGAASRMWSVYDAAKEKAIALGSTAVEDDDPTKSLSLKKSLASNAARSLITTMPYAIENRSGIMAYFALDANDKRPAPTGSTQYFRFEPPQGKGTGGKRAYGQDVVQLKSLKIFVGGYIISIKHLDAEVNRPRQAHCTRNGMYVFTEVEKTNKATIIHLCSHIDVYNTTSLDFSISVMTEDGMHSVGSCVRLQSVDRKKSQRRASSINHSSLSANSVGLDQSNRLRSAHAFGIPADFLTNMDVSTNRTTENTSVTILLSPVIDGQAITTQDDMVEGGRIFGKISLPKARALIQMASSDMPAEALEVLCVPRHIDHKRREGSASSDAATSLVVQVCCKVSLVGNSHPFVELFIQPRAVIQNHIPTSIYVRTPMPYTFSPSWGPFGSPDDEQDERLQSLRCSEVFTNHTIHRLEPFDSVEIYTPGPSVAVTSMCADSPSGGTATGWMDIGWVDIPLGRSRLTEPVRATFPFVDKRGRPSDVKGGSEFYIAEKMQEVTATFDEASSNDERHGSPQKGSKDGSKPDIVTQIPTNPGDRIRNLSITVSNFAVDHIGDVLLEQATEKTTGSIMKSFNAEVARNRRHPSAEPIKSVPFSSFSSPHHKRRITLLPGINVPIRLLQLTMEGIDGVKRSLPFCTGDIALCEGGIESTPILWGENQPSGYFAYRKLSAFNRTEIHFIPEFIIFNGNTKEKVEVMQPGGDHLTLIPGQVGSVRGANSPNGLIVMLTFSDLCASVSPMRVDPLGIKFGIVKDTMTGSPVGSVAVQTVMGSKDSRFVVKIGAIKYGRALGMQQSSAESKSLYDEDFLRFRVRWSEMGITLNDTQKDVGESFKKNREVMKAAMNSRLGSPSSDIRSTCSADNDGANSSYEMVAQIVFHRFTVDYQRIFKDNDVSDAVAALQTPERAQLAVIIHNVRITDCDPRSKSPVVLDSSADRHFFDLCIRTRGSLSADLVKVDLFDLNLAYSDGNASRIVVNTGEEFIWKLLDVANRTLVATAELAGIDIELEWDEESGKFSVTTVEQNGEEDDFDADGSYQPPKSDTLYDVKLARVSPLKIMVTFRRQPQLSRYRLVSGVRGAKLMNYLSTRLKFTVENADLKFAGYMAKNVKGPPDRLIEMIRAVYTSRMKYKLVSMLNSVTLQDWKYLTNREEGGDEYVEGDILRLTGNLAGRSAGYVLKKAGQKLGDGVSNFTGTIGYEIQTASEKVGIGAVGAGVNSVVSGLGDGVGNSVKGVGAGAGKVLRGAGRGIGQAVGGVGGGVQLAAKGIGRGIVTGDGRAIVSGVGEGLNSVGTGIGQGVETAVLGAADGVLTAGKGIFSGVQSVGKGIGGVFAGGRRDRSNQLSNRRRPPKSSP